MSIIFGIILSFTFLIFSFLFFSSFVIFILLFICFITKKGNANKVKEELIQYFKKISFPILICIICAFMAYFLVNGTSIGNEIVKLENWTFSLIHNLDSQNIIDPFDNQYMVVENEETVHTEKIVNSSLYYEEGISIIEKHSGKECIDEYNSFVEDLVPAYGETPQISLIAFGESEDYQYLMKEEPRSVNEISAEIKAYANPTDVPVETYIEEFFARTKAYSQEHTGENAYQTARSADDIIIKLYEDADSVEECTYFGNYCIQYYLESLKYDIPNETKCDICLKISKVIQNLSLRSELREYKTHFLLLSNGFLSLAKTYDENRDNLCFEQFEYHYGTSLYNVGKRCKIDDEEYYKTCKEFLEKYLAKEKQNETYSKSCKDLIERIKQEYPSLNE